MVGDDDEEEDEMYKDKEDLVVVSDKKGQTEAMCADTVVMDTNEIFL